MCVSNGNIHISITKGDFIINEWDEDGYEKLEEKQKELELQGFELKSDEMDFLNQYFTYENSDNEVKMITFCRC